MTARALLLLLLTLLAVHAAPAAPPKWADYVERGFPFYSSVVDARPLAKEGWATNNLTSRGLILKPAPGVWACFDVDLLRLSIAWSGQSLSSVGMAPGSYHDVGRKALPGQVELPTILGTPLLATALHPGWHTGEDPSFSDPRNPGPDPRELSRGPLPAGLGRFRAVRLTASGAQLEYTVGERSITETLQARQTNGQLVLQRSFTISPGRETLWLLPGDNPSTPLHFAVSAQPAVAGLLSDPNGKLAIRVAPHQEPISLQVACSASMTPHTWAAPEPGPAPPPRRWDASISTSGRQTAVTNGFAVDHIDLPLQNPWRRNVRLGDLAFLPNGDCAFAAFDGDVWIARGLRGELADVSWRRFASGLHEPMGIAVRDGELFVHDRNGIWRLRDSDNNGEADIHELFSNAFTQTAETREFAAGLRVAPDGSFVLGKGGIQASARGRHNGTVLRVSRDGEAVEVVGWGFREPFIGVHPRTGLITASDQQGNYIPATPLHIVRDGRFYGYLTGHEPKGYQPPPVTEPLTWIPHPINASGVGQVWLTDAKMGDLNEALIHLGYYRPQIFLTRLNNRAQEPQAAVVSITRDLEFAPLHGVVNPADGLLYVTGFQIWGSDALRISGLARLRPTSERTPLPREITPMEQGMLVRFDIPLDAAAATNRANYSAERWEYRRTAEYGSPHYKLDGSRGQEALIPSSAYLSRDGRAVFVGIPGMRPVMQMRLGWTIAAKEGKAFAHNTYFTPRALPNFEPEREGFEPLTVDLTPREPVEITAAEISAGEGARLAELMGCVACHSTDGSTLGKVGPSFKALFGAKRQFADGSSVMADEAYLRQSIKEPALKIVRGFDKSDTGMPSYDGVLTEAQIESLVLYLKTLE